MLKDGLPFAVYLTFNGNCREAFNYYQTCVGGELTVQSLADTLRSNEMSRQMLNAVVSATLKNKYFKMVGTDLTDQGSIVSGNNMSILIECNSFDERARLINKLIGRNYCSIKNTNPLMNVTDKYRINWILSAG